MSGFKKHNGFHRDPERQKIIPPPTTFRAPDEDSRMRVHGNSAYTPEKARIICKRIMMKQTLTEICRDPRMPSLRAVVDWLANPKYTDFREMYYYARRVQAEMYIDEIMTIADDSSEDWKEVFDKQGKSRGFKPDNEAIQRSRVRIDTRKWYAGQMVPRIYGKRLDVSHDVTGDLKELLESASNRDQGLPKPVNND